MSELPSRAAVLPLVAGALALDFCNTASGRGGPRHLEHLRRGEDVLAWAAHAGLPVPADVPPGLLPRALALRDAIWAIEYARAHRRPPPTAALAALAAEYAASLRSARLAPRGSGYGWTWGPDAGADAVLGPIAAGAVALLARADPARIGECCGVHCGWLFLDTTRNRSRRWCEMSVCGNRAKQSRRRGVVPARTPV